MSIAIDNAVIVFTGEVASVERNGNSVTGRCKFGMSAFDTELPLLVKGTTCSHLRGSPGDGTHLISQGCTGPDAVMKKTNWKFTGLVANPISTAFPFQLALSSLTGVGTAAAASLAGSKIFLDWFAFGFVEIGTGANVVRRQIVGSTVPVAGAITLKLHRYLPAVPAFGATVTLYPGCDGQFNTCRAWDATTNPTGKFNNSTDGTDKSSNFGGDPFTPIGNPSVVGQPNLGTQGAKK